MAVLYKKDPEGNLLAINVTVSGTAVVVNPGDPGWRGNKVQAQAEEEVKEDG